MSTKHTPTPWVISYEGHGGTTIAIDDEPGMQGERDYDLVTVTHGDPDELRANAEFIVRACNAHDELVAALRNLITGVAYLYGDKADAALAEARAALEKAGAA